MHPETKANGDDDPLDVCEIGEAIGTVGQVKQVKILGIMALLDEGETDWKVIVVDVNDPLAGKLNDIEDVERHLPGLIRATNEWFRFVSLSLIPLAYTDLAHLFLSLNSLYPLLLLEFTKFLMESQRTNLLFLEKPRTRSMPSRLFTNVTKLGNDYVLEELNQKSPCKFLCYFLFSSFIRCIRC